MAAILNDMRSLIAKSRIYLGHLIRNFPIVLQLRYCWTILKLTNESGKFLSLRRGPVDSSGRPIPWLTPGSISFLENLDLSAWNMIEFGAGHSTLYFSARVKQIISYECDALWIAKLRNNYKYSGDIRLVDNHYGADDINFADIHVVLVDGLDRSAIIKNLVRAIDQGLFLHLLIIDNPEFVNHSVLSSLEDKFTRVDFRGIPNSSWEETTTAILLPNCSVRS